MPDEKEYAEDDESTNNVTAEMMEYRDENSSMDVQAEYTVDVAIEEN